MFSNDGGVGVVDQVEQHLVALDAAVEGLLGDGLSGLSDAEVVEVFGRFEVSLRKAAGVSNRLVVEAVERGLPGNRACRSITDFLVQTLRLAGGDAKGRAKRAEQVGTWHTLAGEAMDPKLPVTAQAVRDGAVGNDHVRVIAEIMGKVPHGTDPTRIEVAESILADTARSTTPADVAKVGAHLLAHLAPDGDEPSEKERRRKRGITLGEQGTDLMSRISGFVDPELRALIEPVLAKLARPGMNNPDDPESPSGDVQSPTLDTAAMAQAAARDTRTAAQRNHDALKVALRQLLSSGVLGSHRGLPVTTIITMTLQQLEEATGVATTATGGIVPIGDALRMAEKSHPILVLFDHAGRPLHLGRADRLASADQRLALIAWYGGCSRPGCDAPASMTAVHHVEEWNDGGCTDITNETLACDCCHAKVNTGPNGWKTVIAPEGSEYEGRTLWIAPAHLDPEQKPRANHRHHVGEILDDAVKRQRARQAAEVRDHHRRWHAERREGSGDGKGGGNGKGGGDGKSRGSDDDGGGDR